MKNDVIGLVQARMGSTRFPGKMMASLGDHPLLEWVLFRSKLADFRDLILLTTTAREDDSIAALARRLDCKVFRGDQTNVLSRFVRASEIYPGSHFVRICGDNPFVCPVELKRLMDFHCHGVYDYSFNHVPKLGSTYADGFGAEILTKATMNIIDKSVSNEPEYIEHVTSYIWSHSAKFKIGIPPAPRELMFPNLRFDVDSPDDLERLNRKISKIRMTSPATEILATFIN